MSPSSGRTLKENGDVINVADILSDVYDEVNKVLKTSVEVTVEMNPYDGVIQGNVTLTGSADRLSTNTSCSSITVQANPNNIDSVYIGKSNVSASVHMAVLSPGSSMTFKISNVNLLYAFGTANDKVSYGGEV
jgi:hypothetical protein